MWGLKWILIFLGVFSFSSLSAKEKTFSGLYLRQFIAANNDSSRIMILCNWAESFISSKNDSAYILAEHGLKAAKKINFAKGIGRSYFILSCYYQQKGKYDSIETPLQESLKFAKIANDTIYLGNIENSIAIFHFNKNETDQAINHYLESIKYYLASQQNIKAGYCYYNLFYAYKKRNDFKKTYYYLLKSISFFKYSDQFETLLSLYIELAIIDTNSGNYIKALDLYLSALSVLDTHDNLVLRTTIYNNIGDVYLSLSLQSKAIEYFKKSLLVSEKLGNKYMIGINNLNMGLFYFHMKPPQSEKALSYCLKSQKIFKETKDSFSIADLAPLLIEIYTSLKMYDKAAETLKEGFVLSKKSALISSIAMLYNAASVYNSAIHNDAKALEYASTSIKYAREEKNIEILMTNLKQHSIAANKLGLHQQAYRSLLEYHSLNDSIREQSDKKSIYLKEFQYKEYKLNQVRLLKDIELKKETEQRKWILFITLLGSFFLISFTLLILRNLKRQKKYNKKLNEAIVTKDKLLSIISHDLRSPFSSILGFSELLNKNSEEFDEAGIKKISGLLYKSSKSAYDLLIQLLDWSRLQSNNITCTPEKIDAKIVISTNIDLISYLAVKKDIQITDLTPEAQYVYADQNMLNSIMRNLLTNAVKFTYQGGKIEISSWLKNEKLFISIKDNGMGIPAWKMKELFNLTTVDSTKGTDNEGGTGLGLIMCKEFIERNKGELFIESKEGEGSIFIFSLPLYKD